MIEIYDLVNRDPSLILQRKLEEYVNTIMAFSNENHYQHFVDSGLPAVLNKFNRTGKIDINLFLTRRPEKSIDNFTGKKEEES